MQTVTIQTDTKIISGRVPTEKAEQVRIEAFNQRVSVSKLLAAAISHYLDYLKTQKEISHGGN